MDTLVSITQLKYTKSSNGSRRFKHLSFTFFLQITYFQLVGESIFIMVAPYFFSGNVKHKQDKEGENKHVFNKSF